MDGPRIDLADRASLILTLKVLVSSVTVLFGASLVALAAKKTRLHGRINTLFFALTMLTVLGFEVLLQFVDVSTTFDARARAERVAFISTSRSPRRCFCPSCSSPGRLTGEALTLRLAWHSRYSGRVRSSRAYSSSRATRPCHDDRWHFPDSSARHSRRLAPGRRTDPRWKRHRLAELLG